MAGPICRTPDDAFRAGWNEPCDHGTPNPGDCPSCALTGAEIAQLAVLLSGVAAPTSVGRVAA